MTQVITSKMMSPPLIGMLKISRSWLRQFWNGRILGLTEVDTSIKLDEWQIENNKLFETWKSLMSTPPPTSHLSSACHQRKQASITPLVVMDVNTGTRK